MIIGTPRLALAILSLAVLCICATAQDETAQSLLKKGYDQSMNGSHEQALQTYDRVIQIDPENGLAWINKANSLMVLNRMDEATAAYQRALEITNKTLAVDPRNTTMWSTKGLLQHNVGNYEGSVRHLPTPHAQIPKMRLPGR